MVALLPQENATSLRQSHNFLLRQFRFARRPHFHNQNRMSPSLVSRPSSPVPLRKRMDGIVGVVSSFTSDDSELQNPLTFRRQLKTLRVRTCDAPSVNDLQTDFLPKGLRTCVGKMDADRNRRFKLSNQLWGISAESEITDFCHRWVKCCNHRTHQHHSHQQTCPHHRSPHPFCHSRIRCASKKLCSRITADKRSRTCFRFRRDKSASSKTCSAMRVVNRSSKSTTGTDTFCRNFSAKAFTFRSISPS